MLKYLRVENFKGIDDAVTIDLTGQLTQITKGNNKTSISIALVSSLYHLIDCPMIKPSELPCFFSSKKHTTVEYSFGFERHEGSQHTVVYRYVKDKKGNVVSESVIIDGEVVIDYEAKHHLKSSLKGVESLNTKLNNSNIKSGVKYLYYNTNLDSYDIKNVVFIKFITFIENMFYLTGNFNNSLVIGVPLLNNPQTLICQHEKGVNGFEVFLAKLGFDFDLTAYENLVVDEYVILVKHKRYSIPFLSIASNTLKNLSLFYAWLLALEEKQTSLVVLDDVLLDYAPDIAEKLVSELKGYSGIQWVI